MLDPALLNMLAFEASSCFAAARQGAADHIGQSGRSKQRGFGYLAEVLQHLAACSVHIG